MQKAAKEIDIISEAPASTVWVIQQPRPKANGWTPNLQSATTYGRIEFVFDAGDRAYADPGAAIRKARTRLAFFNPDKDYICWTHFGDPATLWLSIMLLAQRFSKLKFLYWSRSRVVKARTEEFPPEEDGGGFYFPIEIDVA